MQSNMASNNNNNPAIENIEYNGQQQNFELVNCTDGYDACLTINWTLPTLKGCTKLSNLDISSTSGYKGQSTRVNLNRVCFTDVSHKINKALKDHLKKNDSFQIHEICACTWDGCNGGKRNETNHSILVIIGFVFIKICFYCSKL